MKPRQRRLISIGKWYQAQVTPKSGYRQPGTLRAAVFVCGAVLGRISRKLVLRLSQNGGGLEKHKALIHKAREAVKAIAPLLPRRSGSAERIAAREFEGQISAR